MNHNTEQNNGASALVHKLQERARMNKVFNSMAHVFAIRERTRRQLTVTSLYAQMKREKFIFSKNDYINELQLLATLSVVSLEKSSRGMIKALVDIKITLQSIGQAALGGKKEV